MLKGPRPVPAILLLTLVAALPFAPHAWEFYQRGVPEALLSGDAAALELRVLHAARGAQMLGPYSQWGWSHPGPAYFYLALPVYELFGARGPALNLFAMLVNLSAAIALVLAARRLRGNLFALAMAALVAVYGLVGVPALLTNEWNPIIPILPLALLCLLIGRLALGATGLWPAVAFVASAIVQTHVGYVGPVVTLLAMALFARRRLDTDRRTAGATVLVLAICWAMPLYDLLAGERNLARLIAFFAPDNLGQQSWTEAAGAAAGQLAVLPLALLRTLRVDIEATTGVTYAFTIGQAAMAVGLLWHARRRGDPAVVVLSTVALVEMIVAVLAVRAIRGDVAFYLVAWISVIGLTVWAALAAWAVPHFERALEPRNTRALAAFFGVGLIALAMSEAGRPRIYGERDVTVEALATAVEQRLRAAPEQTVVAHIESHETWPAAVAVILHLYKRGFPIAVDDDWLTVVGRQLAAPPGEHPRLLFVDAQLRQHAVGRGARFLGDLGWVYVYLAK